MANKKRARSDAEIRQAEEWGVPNWKSLEGYPEKWEKLSKDKKRWEFLRRNIEFRTDWKRAHEAKTTQQKPLHKLNASSKFGEKEFARKYGLSIPVSPKISWHNLPKGFHFKRSQTAGGHIVYPNIPVPLSDEARSVAALKGWDKKFYDLSRDGAAHLPQDWYHLQAWVAFDLRYSIDEQIKTAKENLTKAQKNLKHFMKSLEKQKYEDDDYAPQKVGASKPRKPNEKIKGKDDSTYIISLLRIYDACNCGRTEAEIAQGLYDERTEKLIDESTVGKRHRAAIKYWERL